MSRQLLPLFSKVSTSNSRLSTASHTNLVSIFHITDYEGYKQFFEIINRSSIVYFHPDSGLQFHKSKNTPVFIEGGDVQDRGNNDLLITECLIDFKKRYPDNVFLLAGNRDIKNCRFKVELDPALIRERLLHTTQPSWIMHPTLPLDYVKADMMNKNLHISTDTILNYVNTLAIDQCQLLYLHWMLEKTMGAPHSFRYRREELTKQFPNKNITDQAILNSFIKESSPSGLMGQYLQHAQIAAIIPNTRILALHGGITPFNLGRVPENDAEPISNLEDWVNRYNQWFNLQIQNWKTAQNTVLTEPAYTDLDQSILPIPGKEKFIVTASMLDNARKFMDIPTEVQNYLIRNNIAIVLTGHQPSGDHPALLRNHEDTVLFINGDTGYAKIDPNNPDNTRGMASHVLEIFANKMKAQISIQAILSDGTPVKTELMMTPKKIIGDEYVGRVLPQGELVQCKLADGNYRITHQVGLQVSYTIMTPAEVEHELNQRKTQSRLTQCAR